MSLIFDSPLLRATNWKTQISVKYFRNPPEKFEKTVEMADIYTKYCAPFNSSK